ncbi:hypothetical protein C8R43DRAFT_1136754 [Mycena crocata]|nr:hypothetical protein C8R43DRAFT_1136754 [Mycena crocata]
MPPPGFKAPSMKELRRIEAEIRAIVPPACTKCAAQRSQYRCWECPVAERFCKNCVLTQHARLPLHSIEFYAGPTRGFVPHTLQSLGMRIPLGHDGGTCPERVTDTNVAVASTNGVHNITVDFCGCGDKPPAQQLLDAHISPSSTDIGANTTTTFQLVGRFDAMNDHVLHTVEQRQIEARVRLNSIRIREQDQLLGNLAETVLTKKAVRWEEEIVLLDEEHRRIVACMEYNLNNGSGHQRNQRSPISEPTRSAEVAARRTEIAARRVEEQEEIARSVAEMEKMWESEEWNAAVDAVTRDLSPGPPLFRDLGYDDEASHDDIEDVEQHWSQRPIICHRSMDSEPILREWANLNMLARTSTQMGPGQRRSILDDRVQEDAYRWHALEMGQPSRPPSNKRAAKIKLFTMHEEVTTAALAPLADDLDGELMHHLVQHAQILRYKTRQARGVRANEHATRLLRSQDAKVRRRLAELV